MTNSINEKVNVRAKEMLARLLATENLTIIHKKVQTAMFDPKRRLLVLPALENMSSNMYTGFIGHEVGHALFTEENFDKKVEKICNSANVKGAEDKIRAIYNIVEDARIEKLMKRKFPGLNSVFSNFYKDIVNSNQEFSDIIEYVKTDDSKETFLDRLNGEIKVGASHVFPFNKQETQFLERVREAENSNDVTDIVNDIITYLDVKEPPKNQGGGGQDNQDNQNDSDDSSDDGNSSGDNQNQQEDQKQDGSGQDNQEDNQEDNQNNSSKDKDDESDESDESENESSKDSGEDEQDQSQKEQEDGPKQKQKAPKQEVEQDSNLSPSDKKPDNYKQGALQEAFSKAQIQAIEAGNKGADVCNVYVPKTNLENIVVDYKKAYEKVSLSASHIKRYSEFVVLNKKSIAHMVQEFEMRKAADSYRRSRVSNSGALDTQKLAKYKISDDIFKRVETVQEGKNHGLIMVIDWSGSMQGDRVEGAVRQALIISEFCRKSNIKFDVYTFVSGQKTPVNNKGFSEKIEMFDYQLNGFRMVNVLSHKMKPMEYRTNAAKLMKIADEGGNDSDHNWRLGGTPLNHSVAVTLDIIDNFKKNEKVDKVHAIFLTDGASEYMGYIYNEKLQSEILNVRNNCVVYTGSRRHGKRVKSVFDNNSKNFYNGIATMQTRSLVELLQEATGCNALGFFISGGDDVPYELAANSSNFKKEIDEYRKTGYTILENEGYKQLYIMSSKMIRSNTVSTNNPIEDIQTNRKAKFLLTEFIKQIA